MPSIDQQLDKARTAQLNNHLESIFDAEDFLYRCVECEERKPLNEMEITDAPGMDEGCCIECAKDESIAVNWSFYNGDD